MSHTLTVCQLMYSQFDLREISAPELSSKFVQSNSAVQADFLQPLRIAVQALHELFVRGLAFSIDITSCNKPISGLMSQLFASNRVHRQRSENHYRGDQSSRHAD